MKHVMERSEVRERILKGQAIVIYDGHVLRLDKWIKFHPGGDKAIHHMIGRDATNEMKAYHCDDTVDGFLKWRIGSISERWVNFLPPIQGGDFDEHSEVPDQWLVVTKQDEFEDIRSNKKMCGEPDVKIYPKVPQGIIPSLDLKQAFERKVVSDPADISENYDNELVRRDLANLPSLDAETQDWLSREYNIMHEKVINADLYKCNYLRYVKEVARIGTLFGISFYLLFRVNHKFWSAIFLGAAWQQLVFIAHDAGHISITHNYQVDNIIGMVIASCLGGLSLGWWKRNHNVHHLVTNDPIHDPDIQHLPFFAVSTRLFNNIYSTYYERFIWFDKFAQKVIPLQNFLYYPILSFGRFNLYRLSWMHVLLGLGPRRGKAAWFRYFELAGLIFFNYWFFYLVCGKGLQSGWERFQYIMISHITTMIVHVQITLSHFAMSTSDLGVAEGFPMRQLRTSMDVDCPRWLDFFHGGLHFQVVHHLFPRLPRHNLRSAQPFVIEFCEKVGLKYSIYGFKKGNTVVLNKLEEIAQQAKTMLECAKSMEQEAVGRKNENYQAPVHEKQRKLA
ncbi:LANO_0E04412g1_1 [Lachancea nothofagi CBS 11611]|uniref:Delta 8-(E)-sphingolipid desaturase n=1 Tax=Lachancea nothofagi CBS 11611 TaxID=1266666 RepID=A0A1G4JS31_9SACH|nr:LANO_0E04412g1_1 [Lachancea nothofagi CBS 11611]